MMFPARFKRYLTAVPAGGIVLGTDVVPTGRAPAGTDNQLSCRFSNINGWPVQRIAVTYLGPAGASALTARMYFYEDGSAAWYQIGAQVTMTSGTVSFFDVVALLDMPNVTANLAAATAGSVNQILIVDAVGSTSGMYQFAMGPDLTSQA
jgi:hypothetical protein